VHRYSSLAGFLAHYDALRKIPSAALSSDDRNILAAIEKLLATLRPEERAALIDEAGDAAAARHRERAMLRLRRDLIARGVIDG
jgi:hypothetical protein